MQKITSHRQAIIKEMNVVRKMIITGLFATIVAAFAVTATPALAHEFTASQSKGIIQDKNTTNHIFALSAGNEVKCTQEKSIGIVQTEKSATSKETVLYSGCEAFGFAAQISQVKYEFKAENTVAVENEVIITVPSQGCEVKVPTAGNSNLGTITYNNNTQNGTIELVANVTGITSTGSGTGILCPKGTFTTGTYKGTSDVFFYECLPSTGGIYKGPLCLQTAQLGEQGGWQRFPGKIAWS
jgi:hypothetical protein